MKKVIFKLDSKHSNKPETEYIKMIMELYNKYNITAWTTMEGYTHKNGTQVIETNIMATNVNDEQLEVIIKLAREYNQQSILVINPDDTSYLMLLNSGEHKAIGTWTEVSSENLSALTGWSKIGQSYYTTVMLPKGQ